MKTEPQFSLEKYSGRKSRHTCPSCGKRYCFSYYVDACGNMLDETVGRCDHESSCGYHKTPKQWFEEHPSLSDDWRTEAGMQRILATLAKKSRNKTEKQTQTKQKPLCTIPRILLEKSVRADIPSTFVTFLLTIFPAEIVAALIARYNLGVTRSRDVIYFQVDITGKVRTGKVMKYNPVTGKRIKDAATPFKVNWVHSIMKRTGDLPADWELTQCLFGEHLLAGATEKKKTVALVESEKTAVIASALMPKYIWLATGGKSQLKSEKLSVLKGRTVIAFPDVDGYKEWKEKLSNLEGLTITVSDVLEKNATDKERFDHIDIADWLIRWRQECIRQFGGTESVPLWDKNRQPWDNETTDRDSPDDAASENFKSVAKYFAEENHAELQRLIADFDLIPVTLKIGDPI